jgi:tRNA(Ile2)-agmatinylcytidine synthase
MTLVHLGIDSTDSLTKGMCTSYLGAVLAGRVLHTGATLVDYPHLIRLNPNIPYKTRGNGAVVLRMEVSEDRVQDILGCAERTVEELAVFSDPQANPGIALLTGEVPDVLHRFYERALHRLLTVEEAYETAEKVGAFLKGYKNRRGVIGALAGIGEQLLHDHTYELLVYRKKENWGKERHISNESVIEMDKTVEDIFFNYDYEEDTVCIAPHTVCPVLAGIRGESAEGVLKGFSMVDLGEEAEEYVIYRTNQHTSFHLEKVATVGEIEDYSSVIVEGSVSGNPAIIRGGHVFFELENRGVIRCAAFEPTKSFRDIVRKLQVGDTVRVYGGCNRGGENKVKTINLERMDILTVKDHVYSNPVCPACGKSMSSEGKGKGFQCKRCKTRKLEKELTEIDREISPGSYEPPPSAWRHLYKMLERNRANQGRPALIENWIEIRNSQ